MPSVWQKPTWRARRVCTDDRIKHSVCDDYCTRFVFPDPHSDEHLSDTLALIRAPSVAVGGH